MLNRSQLKRLTNRLPVQTSCPSSRPSKPFKRTKIPQLGRHNSTRSLCKLNNLTSRKLAIPSHNTRFNNNPSPAPLSGKLVLTTLTSLWSGETRRTRSRQTILAKSWAKNSNQTSSRIEISTWSMKAYFITKKRKSFRILMGKCPNCKCSISVWTTWTTRVWL